MAQESSGGHGDSKARGPCPGTRQEAECTEKPVRILSSELPRPKTQCHGALKSRQTSQERRRPSARHKTSTASLQMGQ